MFQEIFLKSPAEEIIGESRFSYWTDGVLGAMLFKGEKHSHMLAASIVGTNKVSDRMSQFLSPNYQLKRENKKLYFQQMQIMVESRCIEGCNLSRHQIYLSPTF